MGLLMNMSATVGLVIIPALLVIWVSLDILDSVFRKEHQDKILDIIRESKRKLQGTSKLTENAEFLINTILGKVDNFFIAKECRPLIKHFALATSQMLNSELHQREISDDPKYIGEIVTLFDNTIKALDNNNLKGFANTVGKLYFIDALDRIPKDITYMPNEPPTWVSKNQGHPLYIVGEVIEKVIEALESQDLDKSKETITHAIDFFPFLGHQEITSLPFFVLKWAENYLEQLSNVRNAGNILFWIPPEQAVLKILKKAQIACEAEDADLLLEVISSSKDAYRTPRA